MPFIISHTAISWCSTCSTMVVLDAYDITLVSLSGTYSSSFYLRKLCLELGFIQTSPTILCEDSIASTSSTLKSDSLRRGLPLNLELKCYRTLQGQSISKSIQNIFPSAGHMSPHITALMLHSTHGFHQPSYPASRHSFHQLARPILSCHLAIPSSGCFILTAHNIS